MTKTDDGSDEKTLNIILAFAVVASLSSACSGNVVNGDSETHWVACKRTEDCSGAQVCQAKRCVEPAPDGAGGRGGSLPTDGTGSLPTDGTGATGGGGSPEGQGTDWSCLGQPSTLDDPLDVSVDFVLMNIISGSPIATADARLCPRLDVACPDPVTAAVNGRVTLPIPGGFDGYAWFTTPTTWPTSYAIRRSRFGISNEVTVQVVSPETVATLSNLLESPQLAGNALALITVRDCDGKLARDVMLRALEPGTRTPFYSIGGIPDKDAPVTDASGSGGWVNVPPGPLTLEAVLTDGTARLVGRHTLFLRPDSLMLVSVAPNDDE